MMAKIQKLIRMWEKIKRAADENVLSVCPVTNALNSAYTDTILHCTSVAVLIPRVVDLRANLPLLWRVWLV